MLTRTVGAVLWELRTLVAPRASEPLSDAQLLAQFARDRDEVAFATLMRRHGGLVWRVCRDILGQDQDAEDAFQATFLVLASQAGRIRDHTALAAWLHGTAWRVAQRARRDAARRRRCEAVPVAAGRPMGCDITLRELQAVLDEEVHRLPQRQRTVFILCCLEGRGIAETAGELGWKLGTVAGTLARARQRLQERLTRRGVTLSVALTMLAGARSEAAHAAQGVISRGAQAILAGTVGAAVHTLAHTAVRHLLFPRIARMGLPLLLLSFLVAGLTVWSGFSAGGPAVPVTGTLPVDVGMEEVPADREELRGQVLDPTGKPVVSARVCHVVSTTNSRGRLEYRRSAVVLCDRDGKFRLLVERPIKGERPGLRVVLAQAPGFGPGWVNLGDGSDHKALAVRLVSDDVPIAGRVHDLEGKPIPGAVVTVVRLAASRKEDLRGWLAQLDRTGDFHAADGPNVRLDLGIYSAPLTARTDKAGRFSLAGLGRDRLVTLRITGETIEARDLFVLTRAGNRRQALLDRRGREFGTLTIHGARFDHAAAPSRPVFGVVRDRDSSKPLAGFTVRTRMVEPHRFASEEETWLKTTTDAAGRYRIVGLPRTGNHTILVEAPTGQPYLPAGKNTPSHRPLDPVRLDFDLTTGVWVTGKVVDRVTGKPVQAQVASYAFFDATFPREHLPFHNSTLPSTDTAHDGTFRLLILRGRGLLVATVERSQCHRYLPARGGERIKDRDAQGRIPTASLLLDPQQHNTLVEIHPGKGMVALTCDLAVDPGRSVEGRLVDPAGKPVEGVTVQTIWGLDGWRGRLTHATFSLSAIDPERPRPFFFLQRERRLGAIVVLRGNEPRGFTVRLQPCGTITGRLLDAAGQPATGVRLYGYIEDGQKEWRIERGWDGMYSAETGKDGRFRIDAVLPGLMLGAHVEIKPAFLGDRAFQRLRVTPGEVKDVGDIRLRPRGP